MNAHGYAAALAALLLGVLVGVTAGDTTQQYAEPRLFVPSTYNIHNDQARHPDVCR